MKSMLLTKNNWFIIGPVATLLGIFINAIYIGLDSAFRIENIGICIVLFTFLVNLAILPLTIKQQKSAKLQGYMQPEVMALQKKYKGKTDQASQMKMMEEQRAIYAKYGVSMMGTCGTMLIQMPILFAMYQVVWKIPAYVGKVYDVYQNLVDKLQATAGAQKIFIESFATQIQQARVDFSKVDFATADNKIVDILYNFRPENWTQLAEKFPDLEEIILATADKTEHINSFLTINISDSPMSIIQTSWADKAIIPLIVAIAIPVLAGLTQWLNTKLMPQTTTEQNGQENNTMATTMKMMNTWMPLMSVFFCFSFSAGIGIYWVAGSVVRCIIQIIVNKKIDKLDVDEMIKKNLEKYNEKRAKQGLRPEQISMQAQANLKNMKEHQNDAKSEAEKQAEREKRFQSIKDSTEYYKNTSAKPGSIAAKARMVQQYNEKNMKKK